MQKYILQFHADPDEVLSWVTAWAQEMSLHLATESFFPEYKAELTDVGRVVEIYRGSTEVSRLALSPKPIDTNATSALDFTRRNPDLLVALPGTRSDDFLRESSISAMADDEPTWIAWKKVRRAARALMRNDGVSVVNPVSGARSSLKSHYYSPGARELAERGVRLLAAGGWNEYELADVSASES